MNFSNQLPYPENLLRMIHIDSELDGDQMSRLEEVIREQTPKRQKTLRLFFMDKKSVNEICAIERITKNGVRKRLSPAVIHLRWSREYILTGNRSDG